MTELPKLRAFYLVEQSENGSLGNVAHLQSPFLAYATLCGIDYVLSKSTYDVVELEDQKVCKTCSKVLKNIFGETG